MEQVFAVVKRQRKLRFVLFIFLVYCKFRQDLLKTDKQILQSVLAFKSASDLLELIASDIARKLG